MLFLPAVLLTGCLREEKAPSHSLVVTYAELLLLHEKEKIVKRIPDSLYQQKVHEFFTARSMREEEFTLQIRELSGDLRRWKEFLQNVTTATDSITAAERASEH